MADQIGQPSALTALIRRARRRLLWQLVADQGAWAACAALGGALLLLLVGTQLLDWYWLALLFGGGFGMGVARVRRRLPAPYVVAQRLDRQLDLHDALSTAYHFLDPGRKATSEEIRLAQREQAELLAASIEPRTGAPWRSPRGLRATAVLALLVCGMFTLRYLVRHDLDFRQPLVRLPLDLFQQDPQLASLQKEHAKKQKDQFRDVGIAIEDPDRKGQGLDPAPDAALSTVETPDVDNQDAQSPTKWNEKGSQEPNPNEGSEEGEGSEGNEQSAGNENAPGDSAGQQSRQQNSPASNKQNQTAENSSLMDKMRDALANLMSKMKIQPRSEGQQSASSSQKGQAPNSRQQAGQKGSQSQGKERAEGQQSAEQQGDEQGESGEKSQNAEGRSGDKAADQQASKDAKSGMGKQDGEKDIHLAEQLAAMGKISEIIGKRSANLTGEVMVEVASGKQQLHTPYSQKRAAHSEAGGEIHRDEVPLIFQQYVQQYFEEVRKTPPPAPAAVTNEGASDEPAQAGAGAPTVLPAPAVRRPAPGAKTPTARIPARKQLDR